jgi:hypothetical protein
VGLVAPSSLALARRLSINSFFSSLDLGIFLSFQLGYGA